MTSIKIKTNWETDNIISDGVRIYKKTELFNSDNLPQPLVEITDGSEFYEDLDVIEGQTYYYMLSCFLGEQEVFTECIEVKTAISLYPDVSNVISLVVARSTTVPSSVLVDDFSNASFNTTDKPSQVAKSEFKNGRAYEFNSNNMVITMASPLYSVGYSDFTVELECSFSQTSTALTVLTNVIRIISDSSILIMGVRAGVIRIHDRVAGNNEVHDTSFTISANTLYHFAIVRKNGIFYFFANGQLIFTSDISFNLNSTTLSFGVFGGVEKRYINNIRISNKAFYPASNFIVPNNYPNLP